MLEFWVEGGKKAAQVRRRAAIVRGAASPAVDMRRARTKSTGCPQEGSHRVAWRLDSFLDCLVEGGKYNRPREKGQREA